MNRIQKHKCLWVTFVTLFSTVIAQDRVISNIEFKISEEQRIDSPIGNVAAESNIGNDKGYTFTILDNTDDKQVLSKIKLNSTTGELTTKKVIDRETECSFEKVCDISFEVAANGDAYQVLSVKISILDMNDNTPKFDESYKHFELSESKPVNYEITLTPATDLDMGENNGVVGYEFSPFSSNTKDFTLKYEKSGNSESLSLVLVNALDHETVESYRLLILAKDAGVPIRTGTLTVSIDVLDENDNKPKFLDPVLNITVTEDIAVGKVIVALQAKDIDSGKNGEVFYQLKRDQTADILDSFKVSESTGELSVAANLDYERDSAHKTILIIACDKGDNPLSATATVYLTIIDVGNNPPQISLTYLETEISPNVILVSENSPMNKTVVHVSVEDTDTGQNGNVTCLTYNTYFGMKEVTASTGRKGYKVFVQHLLNRESMDRHNVTVTCIDGGDMESSVAFVVSVKDENDNFPIFSTYIYKASVLENVTYGAEIVRVNATDADIGDNGRVTYAIANDSVTDFEVEENTGIVRTRKSFDRETDPQEVFKVLAMDNGETPKTSTATVILNILDVNDCVPTFTKMDPFEVKENSPPNTYVDTVTATDNDLGDNKKLAYYLIPDKTGAVIPFDIFEDGRIHTNRELDRETVPKYEFEVGVRDHGIPPLNSSVKVTVNVQDVNDETPYFIFPSSEAGNNTVVTLNKVSENPFTTVLARDNDDGINKEVMYFIANGNKEDIFSIESESGNMYILKYVPLTADKTYVLTLSVYDKGQPSLFSKETLHVTLRYTNVTAVETTDEGLSNNNIIIVVTVVCITVLLSVTIITVICIIRRNDITKCGAKSKMFPQNLIRKKPKPGANQQLANDKVYPEALQPKNKKEVSFSLEDGDSYTGLNQSMKEKQILANHHHPLSELPEELRDQSTNQPMSILRTAQPFNRSPTKFLDHADVPMNLAVNHHREDSHSETSGETATSQDSGNGSIETAENHDTPRPFELNQLNPTAYLIENGVPSVPPRKYHSSPIKTNSLQKQPTIDLHRPVYSDQNKLIPELTLNSRTLQNQNLDWRTKYLNSTSSYPDSDYVSINNSLPHNHYSQNHLTNRYHDSGLPWNMHNTNSHKLTPQGYVNHGYGGGYHNYTSSTKDDDETTTTSGSYTINPEELDEDIANIHATLNLSHVV